MHFFFFRNTVLSFTSTTNIMAEYNTIYHFTFHGSGVWTQFSSVLCSGFPINVLPRAGVSSDAQDSLSSSHACWHNSLPSSHKTHAVMVLYGQQETDCDHRKRSRPFFKELPLISLAHPGLSTFWLTLSLLIWVLHCAWKSLHPCPVL